MSEAVGECVQVPADPDIETLSEVLDSAALAEHLRRGCLGRWNGGTVEEVRVVRVLKHHVGQRCTLEIGLRTTGVWHFLIGKVHCEDRSDVFRAMKGIQHAGFGAQDEFSIPQPLAYLPSVHLLLQEKLEGLVAKEVFKTGDERSRTAAAERCALWLARFQAVGPKAGPVFDAECCLSVAQGRTKRIAVLGGRCAEKAARLLESLEQARAALRPVEMRAGHGSYSPAQIILAEGRTATFDWDGYDVADPARDAARFLAALRRLALGKLGSIRALDGAASVFLRTYRFAGQVAVEENLRFFEAAACHTLAAHHLSHPVRRWHEKVEAMLDEGLRIIEGEATP
jgi:aminoglycoside phosphotransferase (APT) family kinase protein